MNRKWDMRFLRLAQHYATWSKDPSTRVGAVIARGNHQLGQGYNGFPPGVLDADDLLQDRDAKLLRTLHAETNALLTTPGDLRGCTLYVYPFPPCAQCAAQIIQRGLRRVVSLYPSGDREARWRDNLAAAGSMFVQAMVELDLYESVDLEEDHCEEQ